MLKYLLILLSKIPSSVLYGISSYVLFPLLYHIVRYRRKVVSTNLKNSFPEKSNVELRQYERDFYEYLCDLMVETLRSYGISKIELENKVIFRNMELIEKFAQNNQSILFTMGHYGNYEYICQKMGFALPFYVAVPYRKIQNSSLNDFINTARGRYGVELF
ncbi:MAG: lysophospholipid acyltransferase family protein, partial [Leadbetterella sp.]